MRIGCYGVEAKMGKERGERGEKLSQARFFRRKPRFKYHVSKLDRGGS